VLPAAALLVLAVSCTKTKQDPGPRARFVVGDFVVWQGHGLVRVEGSRELNGSPAWVMKSVEAGTTLMVPVATTEQVVRRPASRPDAERLVGVLRHQAGASDDRPWATRHHDYMVTLLRRPLEAQVHALHTLYRTAYALSFGERKLIDTFERVVVGELAHVLGTHTDAMVAELRARQPAFAPGAPPRPPDPAIAEPTAPVVVKDHSYLGKISSPSGTIVVGEPTAATTDTFVAHGMPGDWHAYVRERSDHDHGGLVLIHADALGAHDDWRNELVAIAELNVEGGTMAMISAEVRDDAAFQEALIFPVTPIVQGRGCLVTTDGDGAHRLRGAQRAGRFTALVVDF
jgi:RNA polymerase-interacting CarD/CdnL/TRCF family regulator